MYPKYDEIALASRAQLLEWWTHLPYPENDEDGRSINMILKRLVDEPTERRGKC